MKLFSNPSWRRPQTNSETTKNSAEEEHVDIGRHTNAKETREEERTDEIADHPSSKILTKEPSKNASRDGGKCLKAG